MKALTIRKLAAFACLAIASTAMCAGADRDTYQSFSRFTHPKEFAPMLSRLPEDVTGIAEVAKRQTIHHNLLAYFSVPASARPGMKQRLRGTANVLRALSQTGPRNLYGERKPEQRVVGACFLEAHLLAGMLRHKGFAVRMRAGYFKDIRTNRQHILEFWQKNLKEKRTNAELLDRDPEEWKRQLDAYSAAKNRVNHYIEHWIAEYWDKELKRWRLLDANNTFLKAHSNIEVGFHLPPRHFQFAHEAWLKMREDPAFNPDQYAEEPQDGRSHVRSQLLWDFYTLLNHDGAGYEEEKTGADYRFVKQQTFAETSPAELRELDALAALLAKQPSITQLKQFYWNSRTLRLKGAESDPYSFVHSVE
jgi:hypothetical protein